MTKGTRQAVKNKRKGNKLKEELKEELNKENNKLNPQIVVSVCPFRNSINISSIRYSYQKESLVKPVTRFVIALSILPALTACIPDVVGKTHSEVRDPPQLRSLWRKSFPQWISAKT